MELIINTSNSKKIVLKILKDGREIAVLDFMAERKQSEKLLPAIANILDRKKLKLFDIKKIKIYNKGDSFSALRLGVVAANALSYALDIPIEAEGGKTLKIKQGKEKINIVKPIYSREPNIT